MSEADYIGTYDTSGVGPGVWHHYQNITDVYESVPAVVHQWPHAPIGADAQTTPTAEDQAVDPFADEVADYLPTPEDLGTSEVVEPEPVVVEEVPAVVEATPEQEIVEAVAKAVSEGMPVPPKRTARRK